MNSDAAYSTVYQNRTMTELMLRAWLPPEVSELLDYSTLRSESTKGYDEDGRQRTGDLMFSVSLKSGGRIWLAVLIEMQSSCDHMMGWRMLSYATLFWRRVAAEKRLQDRRLPAILSVVIYSGAAPWTASCDLSGCVALLLESPLWPYTANPRYVLIDVQRQEAAYLEAMGNPVGWSMLLARCTTSGQARRAVEAIDAWCAAGDRQDVRESLRLLVLELVLAGRGGAKDLKLPPLTEKERGMSLAENMDLWMVAEVSEAEARGREAARREGDAREAQGEARGLEAGRREGEQLGLNRGRHEAVLLALELKFGELGVRFWEDHFGQQTLGPWAEILETIKAARTLDELHRYRPR